MLNRPEACRGCPADTTSRGFVPPSGPRDVLLAIVGQGPGRDEAAFGEPFIGESGRRLNNWFAAAGIPREKVAIGNVVWCHLPGDRKPHKAEAKWCWQAHVRPWLESLGASLRVVVPVGVPAMEVLISPDVGASVAGTIHPIVMPWKEDPFATELSPDQPDLPGLQAAASSTPDLPDVHSEARGAPSVAVSVPDGSDDRNAPRDRPNDVVVVAVPVLHPAYIVRGQWAQEPAQIDFLRRAWAIATGKLIPDLSPLDEPPPGCIPTPTLNQLTSFDFDTGLDAVLACDIEGTAGRLIGIGFCRVEDEHAIYVPFLDGEKPYWRDDEWPLVDKHIRGLLRRPLVFHNGSGFDIPFLESCGYAVPQYVDDTMIRHHILYAEQPKGLEELAVWYLGMRAWKFLSHVENEDINK